MVLMAGMEVGGMLRTMAVLFAVVAAQEGGGSPRGILLQQQHRHPPWFVSVCLSVWP